MNIEGWSRAAVQHDTEALRTHLGVGVEEVETGTGTGTETGREREEKTEIQTQQRQAQAQTDWAWHKLLNLKKYSQGHTSSMKATPPNHSQTVPFLRIKHSTWEPTEAILTQSTIPYNVLLQLLNMLSSTVSNSLHQTFS